MRRYIFLFFSRLQLSCVQSLILCRGSRRIGNRLCGPNQCTNRDCGNLREGREIGPHSVLPPLRVIPTHSCHWLSTNVSATAVNMNANASLFPTNASLIVHFPRLWIKSQQNQQKAQAECPYLCPFRDRGPCSVGISRIVPLLSVCCSLANYS